MYPHARFLQAMHGKRNFSIVALFHKEASLALMLFLFAQDF